jgi:hypothetical protein
MANKKKTRKKLDARPDTPDLRDMLYVPTLTEVPVSRSLADYRRWKVPVLDQGTEGACTGFGLASVIHYLLRARGDDRVGKVSPFMLYDMARRYDEWAGDDYSGSSARGAMKGWHKHGVCKSDLWERNGELPGTLTQKIAQDASSRPLGAYFRVNHHDLVAMHCAIAEVGVVYATAEVHEGWDAVGRDGVIKHERTKTGGHAFAIVAYDRSGFWIQNSCGATWGKGGFAHLTYEDWLENGSDVWVARLGVPVTLSMDATAASFSGARAGVQGDTDWQLRPHIISVGNDGLPRDTGPFGTSAAEIEDIVLKDIPRITANWKTRRIVLYAHGGLVDEMNAVQRVAEYRAAMLEREVYPLCFVWKTDFWTTLKNILADSLRRRRPEGVLDTAKDFLLDRLDDALEPVARVATGKMVWDEMKENARLATEAKNGAARLVIDLLAKLKDVEVHLVGHSAGAIFLGPMIGALRDAELDIESCTLWAPACTVKLFKTDYLPSIEDKTVKSFTLFALTDCAELDDDCAGIYHKSLLYLVSNAFEEKPRIPLFRDGVPILGMAKFVQKDQELRERLQEPDQSGKLPAGTSALILAPNTHPVPSCRSSCSHHGDFDDDKPTVQATLARILGGKQSVVLITNRRSAAGYRAMRQTLAGINGYGGRRA